jgi:hypothetical protein
MFVWYHYRISPTVFILLKEKSMSMSPKQTLLRSSLTAGYGHMWLLLMI